MVHKIIAMVLLVVSYNCLLFTIFQWKSGKFWSLNCSEDVSCVRLCSKSTKFSDGDIVNASDINPTWLNEKKIKLLIEKNLKEDYQEDEVFELLNVRWSLNIKNMLEMLHGSKLILIFINITEWINQRSCDQHDFWCVLPAGELVVC